MLYEIRCNLNKENIASLPAHQAAGMLHVAKQKLRAFLKQLHPYSYKSFVRVDKYAHELGIRDRFTDIRNELVENNVANRPGPLQNWTNWADREVIEAPKYNTPNFRNYKLGLSRKSIAFFVDLKFYLGINFDSTVEKVDFNLNLDKISNYLNKCQQ